MENSFISVFPFIFYLLSSETFEGGCLPVVLPEFAFNFFCLDFTLILYLCVIWFQVRIYIQSPNSDFSQNLSGFNLSSNYRELERKK